MFGKIKKILGIEGAKVELIIAESYKKAAQVVTGTIKITALNDNSISEIKLKLIERYTRGRRKNKVSDDYVIGELVLNEQFKIKKEEIIEIPFSLPFVNGESPMDHLEKQNFIYKGLVKTAKYFKGVKSTYTVVVEANVVGTKLDPFDSKPVLLK